MGAISSDNEISDEELLFIAGEINFCFSTILAKLMGKPSYSKIAIITGILENVKQEFYRRVSVPYEENKILQNGDIREYRRLYP